jgi:hypothetical protein
MSTSILPERIAQGRTGSTTPVYNLYMGALGVCIEGHAPWHCIMYNIRGDLTPNRDQPTPMRIQELNSRLYEGIISKLKDDG